jgi:selenide,water dikinase
MVDPRKILRNSTARPGDLLVLTKPLGTGALVAAAKAGRLSADHLRLLVETMTTLNQAGATLADHGASACTDVTGYGLSGHALEMALGADVALHIDTANLPLLPRAVELCAAGFTCGGTRANAAHIIGKVAFAGTIDDGMVGLVNDPQTSGGLLVAVPPASRAELEETLLSAGSPCAAVIGEVRLRAAGEPHLVFA